MKRRIITKSAEKAEYHAKMAQFEAFIKAKEYERHITANRIPKNPATITRLYEIAGVKQGDFVTFPDYPDLRFVVKSAAMWVDEFMRPLPKMPRTAVPVKKPVAALMLEMFGAEGCHFWIGMAEYRRNMGLGDDTDEVLRMAFAAPRSGRAARPVIAVSPASVFAGLARNRDSDLDDDML